MKKYILIAALASLPLFAQDAPENTPAAPQQGGQPGMPGMHGPRGQRGGMKRGQWNPEQNKELMEKFDTDKDGKLSDEEKKAMREEFGKKMGEARKGFGEGQGPKGFPGMNPEKQKEMLDKFDTDKDGKLSDEEKKAMREEFGKKMGEARKNMRGGMRGGHGPGMRGGKGPKAPEGAPEKAPEAPAAE